MPILKRNMATIAAAVSTSEATLTVLRTGTSRVSTPAQRSSRTSRKSTCRPNQTARLRITPTTAAVMAASAPDSARLLRSAST